MSGAGYLRYEVVKPYNFPPEAIGGITGGGILLVLISVVILLIYRRKSTQAEREYKRIQIQMDTLESNVRSECKQGQNETHFVRYFHPFYVNKVTDHHHLAPSLSVIR